MVMKSLFVISVFFLVVSALPFDSGPAAQVKKEVTVRASKHEGFSRIVFETRDEGFLKSTAVTSLPDRIKVQFPSGVDLKIQNKPDLDTTFKDSLYTVRMDTPFRIKVSQLSSPPRLSIDIMTQTKESGVNAASPEKSAALIPDIHIVLDPGHGGYDPGIPAGELREKDAVLSVARIMEAALVKMNRAVYLTRRADQFLSITDRALFAYQKSADIFMSIHLSLSKDFVIYTSSAEAAAVDPVDEAYGMMNRQRHYTDKSKALAENLGKKITEEFKKDVVYRKMDLPLLSFVGSAAVMVEIPWEIVSDRAVRTKISDAFLKGMAAYASQ